MFSDKLKNNCECCGCAYAGGKDYGGYYSTYPLCDEDGVKTPKGLCEFCNPNDKIWYNHRPDHINVSCRNTAQWKLDDLDRIRRGDSSFNPQDKNL